LDRFLVSNELQQAIVGRQIVIDSKPQSMAPGESTDIFDVAHA
jgi:hypothetical protein